MPSSSSSSSCSLLPSSSLVPGWRDQLMLHSAFVAVQLAFAGFQILTKLALTSGISVYVFPVYRNALALAVVGPFAFFLEKNKRPAFCPRLLLYLFVLGFTGIFCNQVLYLIGLDDTSPTFVAALQNATPAFTFALAIGCGLDVVRLDTRYGQCKVLGTIMSMAGALIMSLWEGPAVIKLETLRSESLTSLPHPAQIQSEVGTWQIGAMCILATCLTWAIYLTMQASILTSFPAPLSVSSSTNFFGMIQLILLAVICEKEPSKWAVKGGQQLAGIAYAGIVASGFALALQTWCIQNGSPVLAAVYQPVETIAVAVLSFIFLGETLYLGSLIGGIVIIIGLYLVAWGQKEQQRLEAFSTLSQKRLSGRKSFDDQTTIKKPLLMVE